MTMEIMINQCDTPGTEQVLDVRLPILSHCELDGVSEQNPVSPFTASNPKQGCPTQRD